MSVLLPICQSQTMHCGKCRSQCFGTTHYPYNTALFHVNGGEKKIFFTGAIKAALLFLLLCFLSADDEGASQLGHISLRQPPSVSARVQTGSLRSLTRQERLDQQHCRVRASSNVIGWLPSYQNVRREEVVETYLPGCVSPVSPVCVSSV